MIDAETSKILSEGERLKQLVESDGWKIVRERLMNRMIDVQSVLGLDIEDPQKMLIAVGARKQAIQIIYDWFRDIDGDVSRYADNKAAVIEKKEEFISYSS